MRIKATLALATALALIGSAASATSYTFDFADSRYSSDDDKPDNNESIEIGSVEDPTVTVTLSAQHYKLLRGEMNPYEAIDVDFNSWGIISQNEREWGSPNHAVDSWGKDEAIIFDFGTDVILRTIDLSWDYSAVYSKFHKWIGRGVAHWDLFIGETFEGRYSGDEKVDVMGSLFGIGATTRFYDDGSYRQSAFKIRSITIDMPVPEVPLPASALLLIGGLGGIAAMKRRKV